jgi:hypothetical protein
MKKMITISLALLVAFAIAAPTYVDAGQKRSINLQGKSGCKGDYDVKLIFNMKFSGGFPSWKNETTGEVLHVMQLVPYGQIQDVYTEFIKQDGFLDDDYLLKRGSEYYWKDGYLFIKLNYCMPRGTIVQLKVNSSYGIFQLAVDNPGVLGSIDDAYQFGSGCGFTQLDDGTWGITCW